MTDATATPDDDPTQDTDVDQLLEDAEGGIEGSLLDAPDEDPAP